MPFSSRIAPISCVSYTCYANRALKRPLAWVVKKPVRPLSRTNPWSDAGIRRTTTGAFSGRAAISNKTVHRPHVLPPFPSVCVVARVRAVFRILSDAAQLDGFLLVCQVFYGEYVIWACTGDGAGIYLLNHFLATGQFLRSGSIDSLVLQRQYDSLHTNVFLLRALQST